MSLTTTEIAIIGGGAAGLSAALTLSRARRGVTVIDGGEPRNAPAPGVHGLLGLEGIPPLELLQKGRDEVASYGGHIVQNRINQAHRDYDGIHLTTDNGQNIFAQALIITTGTRDILPDIPGLAGRWGRDVIHCPYCHGWEIRDQNIGLLATGPMSAMQALMFQQWSSSVRFFPQGLDFPDDQVAKLTAAGIQITAEEVTGIDVRDDQLAGVSLGNGMTIPLDALVVPATTRARLDGLDGLGLNPEHSPSGTSLVVDAAGHTSVPGVWAAGNVVNPAMQISEAMANGARVGMALNTELIFQHAEQRLQDNDLNRVPL